MDLNFDNPKEGGEEGRGPEKITSGGEEKNRAYSTFNRS